MTATTEIAFVSEFPCRHCGTDLIGRLTRYTSWMRCPKCGRASLAPEVRIAPRSLYVPLPDDPPDDLLVIGPAPELPPMTPVADSSEFSDEYDDDLGLISAISVRRVVASTILFLSLTMLVLSILNQSTVGGPIFGTTSVVAILMLIWPTKSSQRP